MRTKTHRLIAVIVVIATLCTIMVPVFAADDDSGLSPQASYYINSYWASASGGPGSIKVSFGIVATGKMTSLGAMKIQILNSSGTVVKTFYASETSGMLAPIGIRIQALLHITVPQAEQNTMPWLPLRHPTAPAAIRVHIPPATPPHNKITL